MTAALKLRQIVQNAEYALAIELMAAAQGLEYRRPLKPAREVGRAAAAVRELVPPLEEDRVLSGEIERLAREIRAGRFDAWRR
jgi:histidine ammonia-lyase